MNWIDAIFMLLLFLLSFLGFRRGIIGIVVIIASYLAGIMAAVILAEPAGAMLSHYTRVPETFSRIIAPLIIFLITALAVRGVGLVLKKLVSLALPGIDRACGLLFGLILAGILIALTSIFLYISPEDSAAGRLYDGSFTPGLVIRALEKLSPERPDASEISFHLSGLYITGYPSNLRAASKDFFSISLSPATNCFFPLSESGTETSPASNPVCFL